MQSWRAWGPKDSVGPEVRVGCRPVLQPATLTACGHTLLLWFHFEWSLSSEQHFPGICPRPYPSAPLLFLLLCLFLSSFTDVTNMHQGHSSKRADPEHPRPSSVSLTPLGGLHLCWVQETPSCPECLPSPVASSWWVSSAWLGSLKQPGAGRSSCLIQRMIPCTPSDGWLCSGITNREIKEMLHSHSGKIKCARTNHF